MTDEIDQDVIMKLHRETREERRDFNTRMDNALKYYTTIFSALIATSISLRIAFRSDPARWLLAGLPLLAAFVVVIGLSELRRLYRRYMEQLTISQKLEYLLGYHREWSRLQSKLGDEVPYPKDRYILPEKFVEDLRKKDTSDAFVDETMKRPKFSWGLAHPIKALKLCYHGDVKYVSIVTVLFLIYLGISIVTFLVLAGS